MTFAYTFPYLANNPIPPENRNIICLHPSVNPVFHLEFVIHTSGTVKGESCVRVVVISDSDVVYSLGVVQLVEVGAVGQPRSVPVVDAVKVARVVEAVVTCKIERITLSLFICKL
jgi:hypothetical protein